MGFGVKTGEFYREGAKTLASPMFARTGKLFREGAKTQSTAKKCRLEYSLFARLRNKNSLRSFAPLRLRGEYRSRRLRLPEKRYFSISLEKKASKSLLLSNDRQTNGIQINIFHAVHDSSNRMRTKFFGCTGNA